MSTSKVICQTFGSEKDTPTSKQVWHNRLRKFQQTKIYDLLATLPLGIFIIHTMVNIFPVVINQTQWLWTAVPDKGVSIEISFLANYAVGLAVLINLSIFMVVLLIRQKPVARNAGFREFVTAIYGTYLSYAISQLQPQSPLPVFEIIAMVLIFVGTVFTIFSITALGRSFSILPEARSLVTTGTYSLVRHPLYLGELVTLTGMTLHFISPAAILILLLIYYFQMERMKNEEKILAAVFPEYSDYMKRTYRVLPWIY